MKSLEEKLNYKHIKAISICESEFPLFGKIRWILAKLITMPERGGNRSVRRQYEKDDRFDYNYTRNAHKSFIFRGRNSDMNFCWDSISRQKRHFLQKAMSRYIKDIKFTYIDSVLSYFHFCTTIP